MSFTIVRSARKTQKVINNFKNLIKMENYLFTELSAKKLLQDTYPQIKSLSTMDTKKSFVFNALISTGLFVHGEFFKSIGFMPGSKTVMLEITQDGLKAIHEFRYPKNE